MSTKKTNTRPNPATAVMIVSRSDLRMQVIHAGVRGNKAIEKVLATNECRKRDGTKVEMVAVTTCRKIHTSHGTADIQTSTSIRKATDAPAVGLQDAVWRQKSWKGYIAEAGGKKTKHFVFLSFIRKGADGNELPNPIPMISVDGKSREPYTGAHAEMFGIE